MRKLTSTFFFILGFTIAALIFRAAPTSAQTDCTPTASPFLISTQAVTLAPNEGTRKNPVPLGRTIQVKGTSILGRTHMTMNIKVLNFKRGKEVATAMKASSGFMYEEPAKGNEYVAFYVSLEYLEGAEEKPETFSSTNFQLDSGGKIIDPPFSPYPPSPAFKSDLLPGGKIEGWVAFQVAESAKATAIFRTFFQSGAGPSNIFFALE